MSSLMQFNGRIEKGKVGLLFQLIKKDGYKIINTDEFQCSCGKNHPNIYEAFRKPAGMFGCWVVFRYNGQENVPDLSIPIDIEVLPRGAKKLTQELAEKYWHS